MMPRAQHLGNQAVSRRKNNPLRPLTDDERAALTRLSRASAAPAAQVTRARLLLAVAAGANYQDAAQAHGRKSGDAVATLVARFNDLGLDALPLRHGGGRQPTYTAAERARILREVQRPPTPAHDGTATWSLNLLKKALRSAPDGLPKVSTFTIGQALHDAGYTYQENRTWCHTGTVLRKRKAGLVAVTDPDTEPKKS
jgi:transposase